MRIVAVAFSLALATTALAAPASSTAPASADGAPNAAVLDFLKAARSADSAAMLAALSYDPAQKPVIESLIKCSCASTQLLQVMQVRFNKSDVAKTKLYDALPTPAELEAVAAATPAITGDTAILTIHLAAPGAPAAAPRKTKTYTLIRVQGAWRLDAAKNMNLPADAAAAKSILAVLAATTQAFDDTRAEVDAGKYGSAATTENNLQRKLDLAAHPEPEPTTLPATASGK